VHPGVAGGRGAHELVEGTRCAWTKGSSSSRLARRCPTTGAFGLPEGDRRHVKPPPIGLVRTHESTRTLARHVERGTGRIRSATLTHQGGRWFCSFSVEVERAARPRPARSR
jgi:hypothetical protein